MVGSAIVDDTGKSSDTKIELTVRGAVPGRPMWLVLGQSNNAGWQASAAGTDLGGSTLVNGYGNGWLVTPKSTTFTATLTWTPQRTVWISLAISALALSLVLGPWVIERLSAGQIGQVVRDDGPQSHLTKSGTPTMGGLLILLAILFGTLLWADLANRFVWIVIAVTLVFGLVGFFDDYLKLVKKNPRGLIARYKYFWQSVGGLGAALALWYSAQTATDTTLFLPFLKNFALPLGFEIGRAHV